MESFLQPIAPSSPIRMSTVEIAEIARKRHKHVIRDVHEEFSESHDPDVDGEKSHGPDVDREILVVESTYLSKRGREEPCLLLTRRAAGRMAMRYSSRSAEMRAKFADRIAAMEAEAQLAKGLTAILGPQQVIEPPADLFPANPVGTALETFKDHLKGSFQWMKNSIWQAHRETKAQIEEVRSKDNSEHGHIWKETRATHEDVQRLSTTQNEIKREVRQVADAVRFITRTREPDLITMSAFLQEKNLNPKLAGLLSSDAAAWFSERQHDRPPPIFRLASRFRNLRATEFDKPKLEVWWKADGHRLYKKQAKSKPTIVILATDKP